jgi:hypothetical protein
MPVYNFDNTIYDFYSKIGSIYMEKYKSLKSLEKIHKLLSTDNLSEKDKEYYKSIPIFGETDRTSVFVKDFYKAWDTDYSFLSMYLNFMTTYVKPLFPKETKLLIQKTPNIRFHLPGCTNIGKRPSDPTPNIIGLHNDREFGHPEEEINLIIPITEMYNTNSLFYEDNNTYKDLKLNRNEFASLYLNKLKHYNCINKTDITRVSFDIRVLPYSKYNVYNTSSATTKSKFEPGDYYVLI